MVKLTLVKLYCRGKVIMAFLKLPLNKQNKPVIYQRTINNLFLEYFGFIPKEDETITIG